MAASPIPVHPRFCQACIQTEAVHTRENRDNGSVANQLQRLDRRDELHAIVGCLLFATADFEAVGAIGKDGIHPPRPGLGSQPPLAHTWS